MKLIIGIGEYAVSNSSINTLKTFALASCVAVTAYSPLRRRGAMLHSALPSPGAEEDGHSRPGYYVTTGVPLMLEKLCREHFCSKDELEINIFGGAESIRNNDIFHIGERNIEAVYKTLRNLNLKIQYAEIGGKVSRTVEMNSTTGNIIISTQPITI